MKRRFTILTAAIALLTFLAVPMGMRGQTKITDYSKIVSGNTYYIGATTGDTDYYLYVYHDYNSSSTAGTAKTSMNDASTFVFEGSGTSWTIKFDNGKYLSLKDTKDNGKVQVVADPATFTTSNQSGKIRLSKGDFSVQKNNSGTQFGSYGNTQTDIWLMEVPSGLALTTVTIDDSGITNTDVYTSTAAGSLSATVTENTNNTVISGATVTWSSSNVNVATIANDGSVTLVAEGTTTITASYAGVNGEYGESSATYELNVSDSTPFAGGDVTFVAGIDLGSTTTNADGDQMTKKVVTVSSTSAAFATAEYRLYSGSETTISTSFGTITQIEFTKNGNYSLGNLSTETGNYTSTTGIWTGDAQEVTFHAAAQVRLNQIAVTVTAPSNAVATTTTINVPANFNTDVYTSTTAGTLTATVKDSNDNTISDAAVTWSSSNTDVATIDATGAVTLVAVGTTTITASYAGVVDEYRPSEGTYELTVTSSEPYVQPTSIEANLNNSLFGTSYTGSVSGITDDNPVSGTIDNVTITYAGSGNHYINDSQIRFYPNNKLTFEAPSGYKITEIIFTSAGTWAATISADNGTYNTDNKTWTGSAASVIFTGSGSSRCDMSKATITLAAISSATTITLTIQGYGNDNTVTTGWHLIASPMVEDVTPSAENGFLTNVYDLYSFDQTGGDNGKEWKNYKNEEFDIVNGKGYLYANSTTTTLNFIGTPYNGNGEVTLTIGTNDDETMSNWNLVGNPFNETSYIERDFYRMDANGELIVEAETGAAINRMEGIFVIAEEDGEILTFSTTAPSKASSKLVMNLSNNRGNAIDRAIVRFGEGRQLPKFQLRENSTKLYIPQEGNDYAVVRSEGMGDIPVNFKAENNGTYTLTFNNEEVGFEYLHLIDNKTGNNVDLKANPSYTFEANVADYASRFRLVFSANSVNEQVENEEFAFFNGSEWVINNNGVATMQVIDMSGRVISTETVNGNATTKVNAATGVYMLRLTNGNVVKTQKVIVK